MNNRLYVGNLPYDIAQDAVRECFAEFGQVTDVHLGMDRETGRGRGFAFVTMSTEEEGAKALSALNGTLFNGRSLRVNVAEERGAGPRRDGTTTRHASNAVSDDPYNQESNRTSRGGHRGW